MKMSVLLGLAAIGWVHAGHAAPLTNGSFETGDLTGWTASGFFNGLGSPIFGGPTYATFAAARNAGAPRIPANGIVTLQVASFDRTGSPAGAPIGPTNGSYLAVVTNETSAGNGSLTGSSVSQTFSVPAGAGTLLFDARLLNNDYPGSRIQFSLYDDFGGVAVLNAVGTVVAQFNLDLNQDGPANTHVTPGAAAGGFSNSTGWLSVSLDIASLAGQDATLVAYSTQYGGDNTAETRLLLDNIRVAAAAVPEPASLALLGLGAAGLVAARRRGRVPPSPRGLGTIQEQ